ncbi:phage minor head protein [Ornithinimicrobium sp. LYQ92]|uniref:phage minor head protein n=1 Tax=Serinicoccus sp. LYQ92 TaxID=3378798 RepID=UPI0038548161
MAIDRGTLELLDGLKIHIDAALEATDRAIIAAWARAWTEVAVEWEAALADLVAASTDGQWPSRRQILRARRAQQAAEVTAAAVQRAVDDLGLTTSRALSSMVPDAVEWELRLLASQLPPADPRTAALVAGFDRVDPASLAAIVERTMAGVTADAALLPAYVTTTIQSTLVRGIQTGANPNAVATEMLRRLEGAFNLGRARALVIAHTEILDAHRAAAQAANVANRTVVAKWQWVTTFDERTCIGCLVMHGREFPVTEPGPLGHQQCRCAGVPVAKSWADLGFDGIDEPDDLLPDARAWFDGLPDATQDRIAGKRRMAGYRDGAVVWDDLVTRRTNRGWRDSFVPSPLSLLGL